MRSRSLISAIGLCCLLLLSHASWCHAGVTLQTDKDQYTTGESVQVTVRNELTEPIYYLGMCALSDCLKEAEVWHCEDDMCDAPRQVLLADEEKDFNIQVVGLLVGDMKYRFEFETAILEQRSQVFSNEFFVISTGDAKRMTVSEQVQKFPLSERSTSARVISVNSARSGRRDNTYIARNFKNQDVPSNQEIIRQRKRQDSGGGRISEYGLSDNEVILGVSGVPLKMRRSLMNVLTGEFPFIQSIEEVAYFKGVAQYFIKSDINTEEFADRLQVTQFPSFRLELIRFTPNHIDCILNFD